MRTHRNPEIANIPAKDQVFLQKIQRIIGERAYDPQFCVPLLAKTLGVSTEQLCKKLKALTGTLPGQHLRVARLQRAAYLLTESIYPLKNVALMSGFLSYQGFWRSFSRQYEISPSSYRAKHQPINKPPAKSVMWTIPTTPELQISLIQFIKAQAWIVRLLQTMMNNISNESITIHKLASELSLSPSQLTKKLKKTLGITPMRLLLNMRLLYAAELLAKTTRSVASVAYMAGFFDQSHLSRTFSQAFHCSPRVYRQQKRQESFYSSLKKVLTG